MSFRYRINQWIWGGLDWLFPPLCGGCNRPGFRWCPDCEKQVHLIPDPVCQNCGLPINHPGQCIRCRETIPPFKMMRSWLVFEGPIRNALHQLKYRRNIALGDTLSKYLIEYVDKLEWRVDMVVPVPLGKERKKERGYNQVGLVAMPLADEKRWLYVPHAVVRSRETRSQVGLTIDERKDNVQGAFLGDSSAVSGATILLMDDVATTGATLSSCASALLDAGANSVYALTIARALPYHGFNIV